MTAREQADFIKQSLGYEMYTRPDKQWLDTGSKFLNRTMGSEEFGLMYGKAYTLAGKKSSGKTLLATIIQGMAQKDGAKLGVVDVEDSNDPDWMQKQGCEVGKIYDDGTCDNVALFHSELIRYSKKKKKQLTKVARMQAAEELFDAAEKWMILQRELDENCKLCVVVDSTSAVEPIEELEAGLAGQNMRTKMLAPFLNRMTKRWNKVAANTNTLLIYIAQLRTNPAQMFGNPEYIPGGAGVLYYPSNICIMKRAKKGGLILSPSGQPLGVASVLKNVKNKIGHGSVEGLRCGFQAMFNECDWHCMTVKRLEAKMKGQAKGEE